MLLAIADVLSADDLASVREALDQARFFEGRATAGWAAREVKHNEQAVADDRVEAVRALVEARLRTNPTFALATRPKALIGPLFSRYRDGHAYGTHVDDAVLAGQRSDVSFTLFLGDPAEYDGGELIIETPFGDEGVKLAAGSVFTYPATFLHRVAPVTRGERFAAVGWVRSLVRDAGQRELLFDLDTARRRLFDREGKSPDGDLLARCMANLMRMWCED